jgi:predicted O-linked N-acetylglucosamine transferase (SPINDLY family)
MTSLSEAFAQALTHHQAGRLDQAERLYRQILEIAPNHPDSLHLLGVLAHQVGRNDIAIDLIGKAIAVKEGVPAFYNNIGEALRVSGRLDEAIGRYRQALALTPDDPDLFNNLGLAFQAQGRLDEAVAHYTRALSLQPDDSRVLNNLGNALKDQGRLDEALDRYRQALRVRPDDPDALYNSALTLQAQGRLDDAIARYLRTLRVKPAYPEALTNLGHALQTQGKLDEAIARYTRALAINPNYAGALNNLGSALQEQGRLDEAIAHYTRALAVNPNYPEALGNLGSALQDQGRLDEAVAHYTRALRLKPDVPECLNNLGLALQDQGKLEEALEQFERALKLKPDFIRALFSRCIAQLPILYDSEAEISCRRASYRHYLDQLIATIDRLLDHPPVPPAILYELRNGVAVMQPFLLAYQGLNDRELQSRYGALVCRIMARREAPAAPPVRPPAAGEPVRVGIVSGFFSSHTIWKLYQGWAGQLDRRRFRLFGYHTGARQDAETARAAAQFERFVQGPLPEPVWRERIAADQPHVLIYPEIGMNPMAARLAAQRLAPVQCTSWGHPETSGYPTVDYFLSSELMEPVEAGDHYTEELVRLPNLSIYYQPVSLEAAAVDRADFGLRPGATVYWCCQSLYKYTPQYDEVFARIARGVGDCQFVFINYPKGDIINQRFRRRLERGFSAWGLTSEAHCVFLPRLTEAQFMAVSALCDVFLDSIGWSGGNTTLESLTHDLPIVTLPGPLMRSRHSLAILTVMGITDTVANSVDEYVAIATRLACDPVWRAEVRRKVAVGKAAVYHDHTCVSALEDFLDRVAREVRRWRPGQTVGGPKGAPGHPCAFE